MKSTTVTALALSLSLWGTGNTAPIPSPCKEPGSPDANIIQIRSSDPAWMTGLFVSLQLGIEPSSFPWEEIKAKPSACTRGTFSAREQPWRLFGDVNDAPPRWATNASDPKRVALLVLMPRAEDAYKWLEAQRQKPTHEKTVKFSNWMWALTIAKGDRRDVYGFYDRLPDDARLTADFASALEGRTTAVLAYDLKTHSIIDGGN